MSEPAANTTLDSTQFPLRAGVQARDLDAIVQAFASDAIVHSPITDRFMFTGHAEIRALFSVILETFEDIRYTDELRGGDTGMLMLKARIGGSDIEVTDHMRLDEQGRIQELTVFFRPMPAIAVSTLALGAGLARRKSSLRALTVSLLVRPLILFTRIGDVLAVRLVRPALR